MLNTISSICDRNAKGMTPFSARVATTPGTMKTKKMTKASTVPGIGQPFIRSISWTAMVPRLRK